MITESAGNPVSRALLKGLVAIYPTFFLPPYHNRTSAAFASWWQMPCKSLTLVFPMSGELVIDRFGGAVRGGD